MRVLFVTKQELYEIAEKVGFTEYVKAAEEFERVECEKICKAFAMNDRRVEVSAALYRAADLIRSRNEYNESVQLPERNIPKDFITYVD
jgi:hypothetical protein